MWGGRRIGVRFLGGSDSVVGPIGLSWVAPGMSSTDFDVTSLELGSPCLQTFRMGDGRAFPRNPRSEEMLAKLADDLNNADKDL